jgi:hypothetical protein
VNESSALCRVPTVSVPAVCLVLHSCGCSRLTLYIRYLAIDAAMKVGRRIGAVFESPAISEARSTYWPELGISLSLDEAALWLGPLSQKTTKLVLGQRRSNQDTGHTAVELSHHVS